MTTARINRPVMATAATITTVEEDDCSCGGELLLPKEPGDLFDGASREGGGGGNAFSDGDKDDSGEMGAGGENVDDGGELGSSKEVFLEGGDLVFVVGGGDDEEEEGEEEFEEGGDCVLGLSLSEEGEESDDLGDGGEKYVDDSGGGDSIGGGDAGGGDESDFGGGD